MSAPAFGDLSKGITVVMSRAFIYALASVLVMVAVLPFFLFCLERWISNIYDYRVPGNFKLPWYTYIKSIKSLKRFSSSGSLDL